MQLIIFRVYWYSFFISFHSFLNPLTPVYFPLSLTKIALVKQFPAQFCIPKNNRYFVLCYRCTAFPTVDHICLLKLLALRITRQDPPCFHFHLDITVSSFSLTLLFLFIKSWYILESFPSPFPLYNHPHSFDYKHYVIDYKYHTGNKFLIHRMPNGASLLFLIFTPSQMGSPLISVIFSLRK